MLTQLWKNKNEIIKNYTNIIYQNRKWITIFIVLFLLSIIYALLCIKEYKNKQLLEHNKIEIENFTNINVNKHINTNLDEENDINNNIVKEESRLKLTFVKLSDDNILHNLLKWVEVEYLLKMDNVNLTARGFQNINQCRNKYLNELLLDINLDEEKNIQKEFNSWISNLEQENNSTNKIKWINNLFQNKKGKIAKANNWLENGMPHTHADVILFNPQWFNTLSFSTFIHECTHIDQRIGLGQQAYNNLYKQWGFIQYNISSVKGIENIILRNRLNPDAMNINWIWHCKEDGNYYWIGAVFNSITPDNLGDVSNIAIKIIKDNNGSFYYNGSDNRQLASWNLFQNYFGITNNHYHPAEIAAEYMSIYYCDKYNKLKNKKGYLDFVKWFNNNIIS